MRCVQVIQSGREAPAHSAAWDTGLWHLDLVVVGVALRCVWVTSCCQQSVGGSDWDCCVLE